MRLRGEKSRSIKNEIEAFGLQILQEQAAHELRYGEARVGDMPNSRRCMEAYHQLQLCARRL